MGWVKIGEGLNALFSGGAEVEGTLKEIRSPRDALDLCEGEASQNLIVLLKTAGVTIITPILSMIKGIICTTGGTSSHLAIISREYRIPCIMATSFSQCEDLDGKEVKLQLRRRKGFVYLLEA